MDMRARDTKWDQRDLDIHFWIETNYSKIFLDKTPKSERLSQSNHSFLPMKVSMNLRKAFTRYEKSNCSVLCSNEADETWDDAGMDSRCSTHKHARRLPRWVEWFRRACQRHSRVCFTFSVIKFSQKRLMRTNDMSSDVARQLDTQLQIVIVWASGIGIAQKLHFEFEWKTALQFIRGHCVAKCPDVFVGLVHARNEFHKRLK